MNIRGIVVCVNYDDLLKITLIRNMRFMSECLVITSPTDIKTKELASTIPGVRVYETDAFYRYGAKFNKGLAMEEGFDVLGREGWILIWDADCLFPDSLSFENCVPGNLYGTTRKILANPKHWHPGFNWAQATPTRDTSFPGFFQLFYADDPAITERPWYDVTFSHAGGGDGYFQSRWPGERKIRLPYEVLHLGPRDVNWFGRASERADGAVIADAEEFRRNMDAFLIFKGWRRPRPGDQDVTEFSDMVNVPGAAPRKYTLTGRFDRK